MEEKRIYPYLIDSVRMAGYYDLLLDDKFKLKVFNKKSDKDVYDYFLPLIRNFMFWTFDLNQVSEFKKMAKDLQATVCAEYACNVFEKDETKVICFNTGICFVVTDDEKIVNKLVKYEEKQKMEQINLRDDASYPTPKKETHIYAYILEIYKMIYLEKLQIDIQDPNMFDKVRNAYVRFTQEVYEVTITDKDKVCKKWEEELELDDKRLVLDNEFNLLYKNNKLNDHLALKSIIIVLLIVCIIIGMINLGNWLV